MSDLENELAFLNQLLGYQLASLDEAMHSLQVSRETVQTSMTVINKVLGRMGECPALPTCPDDEYS